MVEIVLFVGLAVLDNAQQHALAKQWDKQFGGMSDDIL